jgi:hypothetical protein
MNLVDDTLMEDSTFAEGIRRSITDSIRTALEQQQGIGDIQNPVIDIWTERMPFDS